MDKMSLPECCGKRMDIDIETGSFIEAFCGKCGDRVYIKKGDHAKPQLIDD